MNNRQEKPPLKCLLGIDPEKTQKCKPSECASCGWEAAEAARRREYVMLDKVKLALRLSGTALDGEVSDLINAAIADLRLVGINIPAEAGSSSKTLGDPLLDRAVVLYAKAEFGFNDDAERYRNAYDYLKCALSLTADYIESGVAAK